MRKAYLCLILALAALLLLGAAQAEVVHSGTIDGGGYWEVDENGVMTIGGEVAVYDLEVNGTELQNEITKVVIGPGVTYLDFGTFSYCYSLTEFEVDPGNPNYTSLDGLVYDKQMTTAIVCPTMKEGDLTLPASVTAIGDDAFMDTHLNSLTLPDGLTSIGSQAFWSCNLDTIRFPATLTEIEWSSFSYNNLSNILVDPESALYTSVNGVLFSKDGKTLRLYPGGRTGSYTVPAGTERIHPNAFYGAQTTALTLPEGVQSIGSSAFSGSMIQTINLPASLVSIGADAFDSCNDLNTVNFAGTAAQWAQVSVGEHNSALLMQTIHCQDSDVEPQPITGSIGMEEGEVTYTLSPNGLLTITGAGEWNYWAFSNNTTIQRAVLESGVTEIGWGGFSWAANLQEVIIPDTVTEIKYEAFYCCRSLTDITIPASVTAMGDEVFDGCSSLGRILFGGTMAQWEALVEGTENAKFGDCAIICSDGTIGGQEAESGSCGDNVTWSLEYGVLTISGEGPMENYDWDGGPWSNNSSVHTVVIGNGVTSIGDFAFYSCDGLTDVTIPDSVTRIGECAFYMCNLSDVFVSASVTDIGWWAFAGNSTLTAIEVSADNPVYASIDGALYNKDVTTLLSCPAGKSSLTIPNGVTSIYDGACQACWSLTDVTIPDSVVSIGGMAFSNCNSLTRITIPASVLEIGYEAFDNCDSSFVIYGITGSYAETYANDNNIPFQSTVTFLNSGVWGDLSWTLDVDGLLRITGSGEMDDFGWNVQDAWHANRRDIKSILIADGITGIGAYAFTNCTEVTSIALPESLTSIGDGAFRNCRKVTSIVIPENVERICHGAFMECVKLKEIFLPEGITDIGDSAFNDCTSLTAIVLPNSVTDIGIDVFSGCSAVTEITLSEALSCISAGAFQGCSMTNIALPEGITGIGEGAFRACPNLTEIVLPNSVTSIGSYAFQDCQNLTSVSIPDSVTSIGSYAFQDCHNLTSVSIPGSVTSIGEAAFMDCYSLTDITIPGSVDGIAAYTFEYCRSLASVVISEGVTSIGEYAFYECESLVNITIPESIISIGSFAICDCYKLTSITIPGSIASIDSYAFYGCDALTIYFDGTEEEWRAADFQGTAAPEGGIVYFLKTPMPENILTLPAALTAIDSEAFADLGEEYGIVIPSGVTSIAEDAFTGTDVTIITTEGSYAALWAWDHEIPIILQ